MSQRRVVVIGGGLAGLACALRLQQRNVNCYILEKSDCTGGRVRTHLVDGYRLDRGFQVLLTSYPMTQQIVDYAALELKAFYPGALVRYKGSFRTLGDPTRLPADTLATLTAPIGSLADKLRMQRLRNEVTGGKLLELLARPEVTTNERLREYGFSNAMVQRFFKPFLGGIFLEPDLVTSSRKFEFVMRMFSQGEAALPKFGMQAIPQQLSNRLKTSVLRSNCGVKSILNGVVLESGERVEADVIVLATSEAEARRLLNKPQPVSSAAVTCLYFAADESPVRGPWLVLNGDGAGPVNNLCVPSELHPTYAPGGKALVSVTVLGVTRNEGKLERDVRRQLSEWYGKGVEEWKHLHTYSIPEALTLQQPPCLELVRKPSKLSDGLFACGDYQSITSIEGAIASGTRCAEEICV